MIFPPAWLRVRLVVRGRKKASLLLPMLLVLPAGMVLLPVAAILLEARDRGRGRLLLRCAPDALWLYWHSGGLRVVVRNPAQATDVRIWASPRRVRTSPTPRDILERLAERKIGAEAAYRALAQLRRRGLVGGSAELRAPQPQFLCVRVVPGRPEDAHTVDLRIPLRLLGFDRLLKALALPKVGRRPGIGRWNVRRLLARIGIDVSRAGAARAIARLLGGTEVHVNTETRAVHVYCR